MNWVIFRLSGKTQQIQFLLYLNFTQYDFYDMKQIHCKILGTESKCNKSFLKLLYIKL